jgi:probable HAF family extracellular repeat protein
MLKQLNIVAVRPLRIPGAVQMTANAINDKGQIVGQYSDSHGPHGFLYQDGAFCRIDHPDPDVTGINLIGINNLGQIVGMVTTSTGTFGCMYDRGTFSPLLRYPGAASTIANGINDRGQIVGVFQGATSGGFLYKSFQFQPVGYPGIGETTVEDINENGQIVGNFANKKGTHGFVFLENVGAFTSLIDYPGAAVTFLRAINNEGQIVGGFVDQDGHEHPFLCVAAELHRVLIPEAISSSLNGINSLGQVVGNAVQKDGDHSFLATLPT